MGLHAFEAIASAASEPQILFASCTASSGGIKAANKSISHVRLKRSGVWWYVAQANHILALRCAIERVFEAYTRRSCRRHRRNPP